MERRRIIILSILFLILLGCSTAVPRTSYLAKVNQDLITFENLKSEFKRRHGGHQTFLTREIEIKRFLDKAIEHRLLLQEAYRLDLQDDPEIQNLTNQFQAKMLRDYLTKKEIEEKSKASDEEVKAIYEQKLGEQIQVQQIVVKTKEEAESILKKLQSGEDFESITREKSIAPSKKYGGRLHPFGWGVLEPEEERVAFSLSEGEMSPVFKSKIGYQILRLESKKTIQKLEFDKVKNRIKAILEHRKLDARKKEFFDSLQKKYSVQIADLPLTLENLRKAEEEKKEDILVSWDGEKLTLYAFASHVNLERLANLPPEQSPQKIKDLFEELVNGKLMQKEALARGYEKVPEITQKIREYREDLMEKKIYGDYILSDIKITEEDSKQYFEKNRGEFVFPEKRKIAHIMVDSEEIAKEVLKKFKEGEPFESLAKSYSKDTQSSNKGGEVGWFEQGKVRPVFQKVFFSLKTGEVSDPVKGDSGYHLFKLLEIQPSQPKEFSQTKKEVEEKLWQKKQGEKVRLWVDKLKAVSQIEISEGGIRSAAKKAKEELSKKTGQALDKEEDKN